MKSRPTTRHPWSHAREFSELELGAFLELARLHRCAKHCGQEAWDLELSAVIH
jgi:hypothetical protein